MDDGTFNNKNKQTQPYKQENNTQGKFYDINRRDCAFFGIKNKGCVCNNYNQ